MAKKKGRRLTALIVLLVIALIAVAALIAWKQWEYAASADFYDGLRGGLFLGGRSA